MVYKYPHDDPADGKQYHVRYTPGNADGRKRRRYWTSITDDPTLIAKICAAHADDDPQVFVREVTPWRPLE